MSGVEKHAQAILDRHPKGQVYRDVFPIPANQPPWCCYCDEAWPCPDYLAAEAVLVAAREHNTRQAEIEQHLERIKWHMESEDQDAADDLYVRVHEHAVAALRLLREDEATC